MKRTQPDLYYFSTARQNALQKLRKNIKAKNSRKNQSENNWATSTLSRINLKTQLFWTDRPSVHTKTAFSVSEKGSF